MKVLTTATYVDGHTHHTIPKDLRAYLCVRIPLRVWYAIAWMHRWGVTLENYGGNNR